MVHQIPVEELAEQISDRSYLRASFEFLWVISYDASYVTGTGGGGDFVPIVPGPAELVHRRAEDQGAVC